MFKFSFCPDTESPVPAAVVFALWSFAALATAALLALVLTGAEFGEDFVVLRLRTALTGDAAGGGTSFLARVFGPLRGR